MRWRRRSSVAKRSAGGRGWMSWSRTRKSGRDSGCKGGRAWVSAGGVHVARMLGRAAADQPERDKLLAHVVVDALDKRGTHAAEDRDGIDAEKWVPLTLAEQHTRRAEDHVPQRVCAQVPPHQRAEELGVLGGCEDGDDDGAEREVEMIPRHQRERRLPPRHRARRDRCARRQPSADSLGRGRARTNQDRPEIATWPPTTRRPRGRT